MSRKSTDQPHIISNHQTMTPERRKAMQECLKGAEQIRQEVGDRKHSDSTELMAEGSEYVFQIG